MTARRVRKLRRQGHGQGHTLGPPSHLPSPAEAPKALATNTVSFTRKVQVAFKCHTYSLMEHTLARPPVVFVCRAWTD